MAGGDRGRKRESRWWGRVSREAGRGGGALAEAQTLSVPLELELEPEPPAPSALLTVQEQLGLFHKRRCDPKTEDETSTGWGPPLGRLAQNREMLLMGILSHRRECKINTSGLGVLRCSLQGREVIFRGLLGPFPPGTLGSLHTPLQTTPASFPRKREITLPWVLFVFQNFI